MSLGFMTVLAACGGVTVLAVPAGMALYLVLLRLAIARAPAAARPRLVAVLAAGMGLGVVFGFLIPGGLSDTGADYGLLFLGAVAVSTAIGLGAFALSPAGGAMWRHALVGALGGSTFIVWVLGLAYAATDGCLS